MSDRSDYAIGRSKPPVASRFPKGESGNPRGRPRKKRAMAPYEAVLGQIVTVSDEDGERSISVEEAISQNLFKRGLQNNVTANRQLLKIGEAIRAIHSQQTEDETLYIQIKGGIFSMDEQMTLLNMGRKLHRDSPAPRFMLDPWIVEAALARFGDRQLSVEEQRVVWEATRTPNKVEWPAWWTEHRGTGRKRPRAPLQAEDGSYPPCIVPQ